MKTALALLAAFTLTTHAQLIETFSGGNLLNVGPGTAGFSFTVGPQTLLIETLGVWASNGALTASHEVGLWDASQHLLASANVPASTPTDANGWAFVNISPLTLAANTTYVLGAQYLDVDFDQAAGNATSVTTHGMTIGDALLSSGTGFEFPSINVSGANDGFFGPNAGFQPVPEPAATSFAFGVALIAFAIHRRYATQKQA